MGKHINDGCISCNLLLFHDSLSVGDKVITAGGIYGKIKEIKGEDVILEIADNVRIRVAKSSIYGTAADSNQQQAQ